jgi:hypothetical protein
MRLLVRKRIAQYQDGGGFKVQSLTYRRRARSVARRAAAPDGYDGMRETVAA